jgi:hypothetical protein
VFTVQKALLCNSSPYFKAALNGPFIEGQTQTIDLDDEDPSIFRTYVAWLYQGRLNSQDIEEDLHDPRDFEIHIAELVVFADKRDIGELKNDAISMLLNYLQKSQYFASLEIIKRIYNMPKSTEINELRRLLAQEEVCFGRRLEKQIDHWHPEFMAEIIKVYKKNQDSYHRFLPGSRLGEEDLCTLVHKHALKAPRCSSLIKNRYVPAPPPAQQPPNKKLRVEPSVQTVLILDD